MTDVAADGNAELAGADAALVAALRAGDAEAALAWARRRQHLVERLAEELGDGSELSRRKLISLAAATTALTGEARAERDAVMEELGEVRARRSLLGRLRGSIVGESRDEPRFVSRRA